MPPARLLSLALAGATGLVLATPAAALATPNAHGAAHGTAVAHAAKAAHVTKPAHPGKSDDAQAVDTDPGDKTSDDKASDGKATDGKATDGKATDDKTGGHPPAAGHPAGARGASHALAAATASVTRVAASEQTSPVLGAPDRAAMARFNARALAALSSNVTAAGSATSQRDVAAVLQAGKRTAHAVKLVENVVTGSARDTAVIAQLASSAAALKAQEAGVPAGTDTSSVDSALGQLATQLAAARAALSTATAAALAMPASPAAADLQAARSRITPARENGDAALSTAARDLTAAQAALAALTTPVGG